MRPSINAFLGYTYQQTIAFLLIAKMDSERNIDHIEIEATVDNNFDDVKITFNDELFYCQIKDIDNISLRKLVIKEKEININGKKQELSTNKNLLFFKQIECECNTTILGLPAYNIGNVYIISMSRIEVEDLIINLYNNDIRRRSIINCFFEECLDKRILKIKRENLPSIEIYSTQLLEKTIDVGKKLLEFDDILFIEGKPGVGKSHLVTCLEEEYKNSLIYRFWISNQDRNYGSRLLYKNFIANISKELFQDYRYRTEEEIIEYLSKKNKIVIIDGLDHVENYRPDELNHFISFIDRLKGKSKVIVLSRPLRIGINWKKQQLVNWTFEETKFILEELFHITDYSVCRDVFEVTDGYPILVRFVTNQYKQCGEIRSLGRLESTNEYYEKIISSVNTKTALALFLSSNSYIMKSEILLFLETELADIVNEFIKDYPYLFEIKLNRISLFHDSLNTYLINKGFGNSNRLSKVKRIVYDSLMNDEKRFMSRIISFDLDKQMKLDIIQKYTNMNSFCKIIEDCIDIEAIKSFYEQLRGLISQLKADELTVYNYYDLSLIINILMRDHVSTLNEFLYTYVRCLLYNGYNDDDITSSEHLFGMYYYYKTKDAILLHNITVDQHYNTEYFYQELEEKIWEEENYFNWHQKPICREQLKSFLSKEYIHIDSMDYIPHLLANIYIHNTEIEELKDFYHAINIYIHKDQSLAIRRFEEVLTPFKSVSSSASRFFLPKAKDIILSLGTDKLPNEYLNYSLKELILKNSHEGSFEVWPKVLNYIRMSLYHERQIDLSSIGCFFSMYNQRKDVTVISLYKALKTFEEKGLISIDESLKIIIQTQNMSEKGIRHLLLNYIELHEPEIISDIENKYHPDDLPIVWFDLPAKFINHFSDKLFNYALHNQLLYWNNKREVKFEEIENVFYSDRKHELIDLLKFLKYRVKILNNHICVNDLKELNCFLTVEDPKEEDRYYITNQERYEQGILNSNCVDIIEQNNLSIVDVASYCDDYHSTFSDLEIYKVFNSEHVRENTLGILQAAITGKVKSVNMYANLFHFPGNVILFVEKYNVNICYSELFQSFMQFLQKSLITKEKM